MLYQLIETLRHIAIALLPVIPTTATAILSQLGMSVDEHMVLDSLKSWGGIKEGSSVKKGEILFPRLTT